MKCNKSVRVRFHILQSVFWCAYCTLTTYMMAWLLDLGLSHTYASLILAVGMVVSFLGQMLWGKISDDRSRNRETFILCAAVSGGMTFLICLLLKRQNLAGVFLYPFLMFFSAPLATNLDQWENQYLKDSGAALGISRGCSAAAFSIFHFFYAAQVAATEYRVNSGVALLLYGLTCFIAFLMPSVRKERSARRTQSLAKKPPISVKALLENKVYLNLLVIVFLAGLGTSPINSIKITLYQNVGQNVSFLGIDSLFSSGVQIPLFFLTGILQKISAYKRLLVSTVMLTAASGIIIMADRVVGVLAGIVVLTAAYPLLLMSVRQLILKIVAPGLQTTANGICDATYANIAGVAAMLYSGIIVDCVGVRAFMIVCFVVFSGAFLFSLLCFGGSK